MHSNKCTSSAFAILTSNNFLSLVSTRCSLVSTVTASHGDDSVGTLYDRRMLCHGYLSPTILSSLPPPKGDQSSMIAA